MELKNLRLASQSYSDNDKERIQSVDLSVRFDRRNALKQSDLEAQRYAPREIASNQCAFAPFQGHRNYVTIRLNQ